MGLAAWPRGKAVSPVLEQNQLLGGAGWVIHVLFPASSKCLLTCSQDFANNNTVKVLDSLKTPATETWQSVGFFPFFLGVSGFTGVLQHWQHWASINASLNTSQPGGLNSLGWFLLYFHVHLLSPLNLEGCMKSCSLVQAFLSALEAGTTSQCPGFPPVSSLDMELLASWCFSRWDRS